MSNRTARMRYDTLSNKREPYLWRARRNATLTLPTLMPFEGSTGYTTTYEPYQSVGAEGTVHLASRLMLALLPPGRNFFRLDVPAMILSQAAEDPEVSKQITDWRRKLAAWEAAGQAAVDDSNWRQQSTAELQQLIVAGNVLEYVTDTNDLVVYRLDQYVVRRDWKGTLLELIILEKMAKENLPKDVQVFVTNVKEDEDVHIYTSFTLNETGTHYDVFQEVNDIIVPTSVGFYTVEEFPYRPLRWTITPGEAYGRSKIDEYGPDLRTLEGLEKSLIEGAAMAARNFIMLKPTATAGGLRKRLATARNGEVLVGDYEQMMMMSFDNRAAMVTTAEYAQRIENRLRYGFLLNRSVQRDAERVTATEIHAVVEDIENSLGDVYSTLSREMMEWRLAILLRNLQRKEVIPIWPDGVLKPRVLTGIEALSRDRDVLRVRSAAEIIQMFGEPALSAIDITELLRQAFIGLGLHDVTLSTEEIERREALKQQMEAMVQAVGKAVPELVKQQGQTE